MTDFGSTKTLRARKEHECDECDRTIGVGETYHRHAGVWEGGFFTNKSCAHCAVARRIVDTVDTFYNDVYFGGLSTWMDERLWREPWGTHFVDQEIMLLRIAVGYRMKWRHRFSGELMPTPAVNPELRKAA